MKRKNVAYIENISPQKNKTGNCALCFGTHAYEFPSWTERITTVPLWERARWHLDLNSVPCCGQRQQTPIF